ncbi:hypothetical protein OG689_10810 [Kitasatospora sp. NBC_00240]|uniref:hypothetical protein n=1 Tax=Kitasatospora sp. NBC_00240 TaxID=2903567 RepID=UPI0022580C31|nr:hypothetical protein [Kitasatospora sp. NBC_00240]MCX5209774.1 hypothetical protein [Kitasatospora sp. NBC_00240]
MAKQLTVFNATVTTAAVEVKTLTISGKQVTLAVFRQLREERLITKAGELAGEPWGYVNYHPEKCESDREHRHYVWQQGTELLRSKVYGTPEFDPEENRRRVPAEFLSEAADQLLDGRVREWLRGRLDGAPLVPRDEWSSTFRDELVLGKPFGFSVKAFASDFAMDAAAKMSRAERSRKDLEGLQAAASEPLRLLQTAEGRQRELARGTTAVEKAEADLAEAAAALDARVDSWGLTYQELGAALTAAAKAEAERRERHREARRRLGELPQLFIAV